MLSPFYQSRLLLAIAMLLLTTAGFAQLPCPQPPQGSAATSALSPCLRQYTAGERLKDFARRTIGPRAFLTSAAVAGIQQARNSPSAWGQGAEGYGHRFGSNMAKRGVSNTVQLGVEAALGEDSRYLYSDHQGFWPRMKDAVIRSFLVRSRNGARQVAVGRIAGALGGGLLSRTWQPEGHRGVGAGFRSSGISFGGYLSANLFREMTRGISNHLPF